MEKMKYVTVVAFLFLITGEVTYGAVTGSKCSNPKNENLPYDGEYAFNGIMNCLVVLDDKDVPHCNRNGTLLDKCILDISDNLRACTDSTSSIPALAEDVFEITYIHLCRDNNGTRFKEFVDFNLNRECISAISKPIQGCHSSKNAFDVIRNINLPKYDFCKNAHDLVRCVKDAVKAQCSSEVWEFTSFTLDTMLAPCWVFSK